MILNDFRNIIVSFTMIVFMWLCLILDLNFNGTFISSLPEQITRNSFFIFLILFFIGIIGFTYKNNRAYYSLYIKLILILGYIIILSQVIAEKIVLNSCLSIAITILFSVSFIALFLVRNQLKDNTRILKSEFNPITKYDDLYSSRHHQADALIRIIKNRDSDCGYALCISAEWGSGKTSFINSVINRINLESKNNSSSLSIAEIRINAMELDNLPALINYFFYKIKEILKDNGVYVGINSEYHDLIGSLAGTVTTETAGVLIKKFLMPKSDYREKLTNLNKLIGTQLRNIKIIVVVDDLERCTKEKSLEFLYFIKEIAMLNRCIIICLSDYNKLKECTELNDNFLEKFFNYTMSLHTITAKEIIEKSIKDINFLNLVNQSSDIYSTNIKKAQEEGYLYITDKDERNQYKERRVSEEKTKYNAFIDKTQNPRRLIKIYKKYKELLNIANPPDNRTAETYRSFIKKVDYKKQIFIISMIYGFDINLYEQIEHKGIDTYMSQLMQLQKSNNDSIIDDLAYEEWGHYYHNYIADEKLRFISCLLSSPDELPKIATSFTSLQEEYISLIRNGKKPEGVSLSDILKETINARFSSEQEIKTHITKTMLLYKDGTDLDEALSQLTTRELMRYIIKDSNILEIFYETFKNTKCSNKQKCLQIFESFAKDYLFYRLSDITNFVSISVNDSLYDKHIRESILIENDCSSMICAYYDKLTDHFKLSKIENGSPLKRLNSLYQTANEYCEQNNITSFPDVNVLSNRAKESINCINYLLNIEECINSNQDIRFNGTIIGNSYSEKLDFFIERITIFSNEELIKMKPQIDYLLNEISDTSEVVSKEELDKINKVIEIYFSKFEDVNIAWRKLYIKIKQKIIDK